MPPERRSLGARRVVLVVVAAAAAVAVGLVGFSIGRLSTINNPAPSATSAEAGFARDMQVHHLQGVELAMLIRDRTDDEAVRLLGYDIATTQSQQAGQLYGWLTEWELSQAGPEPSMTWMTRPGRSDETHGHTDGAHTPGAPMPGLATDAQIAELTAATGVDAERQFLTLMIAHHRGAVEMAEAVQDRASNTSVLGFANSVIISQNAEITLMESMLAAREP
ncbi:DUF305 domain-containing protein [Cryobacterium arcticum]|uniref:DUF305 domain-containing protein n=1 Tax=Cryobacterium arcticum TaxID=670052 RepID=A0A318A7Q2_9MICO|nr:DUF305 domain-containing protein [Cryobacterium arcticum]PXA73354.1 DUF305 domain-containing protein [Cryobacterium arcticum]